MDIAISLAPDAPLLYLSKTFLQVEVDGNTRAARETLKKVNRRDFPGLPGVESYLDSLDGRFKEALDGLAEYPRDVLDVQKVYRPKPLMVGFVYLAMNDRTRARIACESARQVLAKETAKSPRDARMRSALGMALACLGRKDEAVREARLAADLTPVSGDAMDGPTFLESLALVYVMVGEFDAAIDLLDKLLAMPAGSAVNLLKIDPGWAPLWNLPRFKKLMEKYG